MIFNYRVDLKGQGITKNTSKGVYLFQTNTGIKKKNSKKYTVHLKMKIKTIPGKTKDKL